MDSLFSGCLPCQQPRTRGIQGRVKRFHRQLCDEWLDDRAEHYWDTTCERDRFTLNIHTPVPLLDPPIRVQRPQKTVVTAGWLLSLILFSRIFDLGHFRSP